MAALYEPETSKVRSVIQFLLNDVLDPAEMSECRDWAEKGMVCLQGVAV